MVFGRGQNANTGNGRGMFAASHAVYSFLILLYFLAWIIELAGVSSTQYECNKHPTTFARFDNSNSFPPTVGSGCRHFLRFPWFIVALGVLPIIIEISALLHRKTVNSSRATMGKGAAMWAVLAVLTIFMCNSFYNLLNQGTEVAALGALPALSKVTKARIRCAVAGFALTSTFALLLIILSPWATDSNTTDNYDNRSTTTTQSEKPMPTGGAVLPPTSNNPPQVVVA